MHRADGVGVGRFGDEHARANHVGGAAAKLADRGEDEREAAPRLGGGVAGGRASVGLDRRGAGVVASSGALAAGLRPLRPSRAAVSSSGFAVGSAADVNSVVIIGTLSPCALMASIARGRSCAARSGSTCPFARTVRSTPS